MVVIIFGIVGILFILHEYIDYKKAKKDKVESEINTYSQKLDIKQQVLISKQNMQKYVIK
jgi:hypothetical protein